MRLKGLRGNSIIAVTYRRRFGGKVNETAVTVGGGARIWWGECRPLAKKAGEWKERLRLTFSSPHQQVFPHPHQTQPQHHTRYTEPSRSNTPRHTHKTHETPHITHLRPSRTHIINMAETPTFKLVLVGDGGTGKVRTPDWPPMKRRHTAED